MTTINVGILGGDGAGKSTTAADCFAKAKRKLWKVDQIQEFIREELNDGFTVRTVSDQYYVLSNQRRKENIVPKEVWVKFTDSPTPLSFVYGSQLADIYDKHDVAILTHLFREFLLDITGYDFIILLKRVKPYIRDGTRNGTAEESDKRYNCMKAVFDLLGIRYVEMDGDEEAVTKIIDIVEEKLIEDGVIDEL